MRSRKKKALAGFLFLLSLRDKYGKPSVGDGVLQWSAAEQMPLGYDVPSARSAVIPTPVTVSLAWESVSKRGERIAASLRAAKQVPLGYSSQ